MVNFPSHFLTTDYTERTDFDKLKADSQTDGRQSHQGAKGGGFRAFLTDLASFGIGLPVGFYGRKSAKILGAAFLCALLPTILLAEH